MAQGITDKLVYVAEDDRFYANVFKTKLDHDGINVQIFENGEELLKGLDEKIPNLILLDLIMPVMDGFEALKNIKANEKFKNIPVVVLSNLEQKDDIKRAMDLGATEYLVKINLSLNQMVEKALEHLH